LKKNSYVNLKTQSRKVGINITLDSCHMLNYDKFNKIVNEKLVIQNKTKLNINEKMDRKKTKEVSYVSKEGPKDIIKNTVPLEEIKDKDDVEDLIKPKEEISNTKEKTEIAIESLKKIDSIITKTPREKKLFLYRLQKVLRSALIYLYENNIPIFLYYEVRPIPNFPYSKTSKKVI
jgi:hypothetical protein